MTGEVSVISFFPFLEYHYFHQVTACHGSRAAFSFPSNVRLVVTQDNVLVLPAPSAVRVLIVLPDVPASGPCCFTGGLPQTSKSSHFATMPGWCKMKPRHVVCK